MIERGGVAMAAALALVGLACGHPEKSVVDQYFNAVNQEDSQTLSSFAAVTFDQKVEAWKIKSTLSEDKQPAPLPALVQEARDAEAAVAANRKAATAWSLDNFGDLDRVREARKVNKPVPAKLSDVAAKWDEFNEKDRELKKTVAITKEAVDRERRAVARSVGDMDDVENLQGEVTEKKLEIDLTIGGQVQPYVMTLLRYDLTREGGPRVVSRWVVQALEPKA
ncbi:MAG TPA: hypothetical protein VMR21_04635 [Vicinamibacteria bacterium]|nr:hypothetical protein [Vicinamibacteria bacterium]